jgi:adenylosuccinate synthase
VNFTIKTVLGASYGDEGKGKVISMLTEKIIKENTFFYSNIAKKEILGYSIRSNGGPNGGHALVAEDGTKVTGHVLPSAITKKGFLNIIGAGCCVHLAGLQKEINDFREANLYNGDLVIDPRALVILDAYRVLDGFRGKFSTGSGIADVYGHASKRDGIRMGDIAYPGERNLSSKIEKLSLSLKSEYLGIAHLRNIPKREINIFLDLIDPKKIENDLLSYSLTLGSLVNFEIESELPKAAIQGRNILNETSQSYFLSLSQNDQNGTSSVIDPNWLFISQGIPIMPQEVHLITKFFPSRVGNGAFPGEIGDRDTALTRGDTLKHHNLEGLENKELLEKLYTLGKSANPQDVGDALRLLYNEFGETTSRPRGKSALDLTYLRTLYRNIAASPVNKTYLWINQVDDANHLFDKIPLIDFHTDKNGVEIREFLTTYNDCDVAKFKPNTLFFPSWSGDLVPQMEKLPNELITILDEIKKRTNLSIGGIGVGRVDTDVVLVDYLE